MFANPKSDFISMIEPHCNQTAKAASEHGVILSVGDTTYTDYDRIVAKREGYGPIGKGGNGLILGNF